MARVDPELDIVNHLAHNLAISEAQEFILDEAKELWGLNKDELANFLRGLAERVGTLRKVPSDTSREISIETGPDCQVFRTPKEAAGVIYERIQPKVVVDYEIEWSEPYGPDSFGGCDYDA